MVLEEQFISTIELYKEKWVSARILGEMDNFFLELSRIEHFKKTIQKIIEENIDIEISLFIDDLFFVSHYKTIDWKERFDRVKSYLKIFKFKSIELFKEACLTYTIRTAIIDNLKDNNAFCWTIDEIEKHNSWLTNEIQTYSYDNESRLKYLKDYFETLLNNLKTIENVFETDYLIKISKLFEGDKLVASKEDINLFFVQCEMYKPENGVFLVVSLTFKNYITVKNKLTATRNFINNPIQSFVKKEIDTINIEMLSLHHILKKESLWTYITNVLAEKKLIDIRTNIATDEQKGNKSYFISLIKILHSKGFYKNDKLPTNQEIKFILKNTFCIDVSVDLCKKVKNSQFHFDYIKYANEIE